MFVFCFALRGVNIVGTVYVRVCGSISRRYVNGRSKLVVSLEDVV